MVKISASGLQEMPSENLKKVKITDCETGEDGSLIETIENLSKIQLKDKLIAIVREKGRPLSQREFVKALKELGIEGVQYEKREAIMKEINKFFEER